MKCLNCGKEYEKTNAVHKYCSERCRYRHKDANRKSTLISRRTMCPVCGKVFTGTGITCSKECGNIRQKKKNKEIAIKKFNVRNKERYFYVGGYDDYESDIYVKCKACRSTIHLGKGSMRKNIKGCPECLRIARAKEAREYEVNAQAKARDRRLAQEKRLQRRMARLAPRSCAQCGEEFTPHRIGVKYCSAMCCNRASYKKKEITRRLRISKNGAVHWDISVDKLIKRDKGVCHICGKRIDKDDYKKVGDVFIAGPMYPSIDHVKPLALGGTHTWENVKLAHKNCNEIKSASPIYEGKNKQMMFVC